MQTEAGTLSGEPALYRRAWTPESDPRAAIVLAHGLAEHSGRYDAVAQALTGAGYAVHAIDLVGHGRSPGRRCHVDRFGDYVASIIRLAHHARSQHPGVPLFMLGHSMGGLIATHALLSDPELFAGGLLSGPAILPAEAPPAWQMTIGRWLSRLLPTVGLLQLDASLVSRDPDVVARYQSDPLVHGGKMSARLASELFEAMAQARDRAGDLHMPLLIQHGGADSLTAPAGSRLLADRVGSADVTLHEYDGLFHEIFNEPERDRVLGDVLAWLDRRAAGAQQPAGAPGVSQQA
jgi:alpha-beta hydrolase superfamily lysophospholipase